MCIFTPIFAAKKFYSETCIDHGPGMTVTYKNFLAYMEDAMTIPPGEECATGSHEQFESRTYVQLFKYSWIMEIERHISVSPRQPPRNSHTLKLRRGTTY